MLSDFFLKSEAKRAERWLLDEAFPLWLTNGVDWKYGGFFEDLDANGKPVAKNKRLRSACRQIYVATIAHEMQSPYAASTIEHGLNFLLRFARSGDGGYFSTFDPYCVPTSSDIDTYDLSFVLFAFAHVYKQLRLAEARDAAIELLKFVQQHLAHPNGGFLEGRPSGLIRRQNPHMHLFEACLEWVPLDETGAFREQALQLKGLFDKHFHRENAVVEFFDENWNVLEKDGEVIVEPGHVFEWCWLLYKFETLFGNTCAAINDLMLFGRNYGISSPNLLAGEINLNGRILKSDVRLWPHAEWVRAEIVARKKMLPDRLGEALRGLWLFLDHSGPGLWSERYHADKGFDRLPSPATSLYHITGAFVSLIALSVDEP